MRKLVALAMFATLSLPAGAGATLLPQDDAGSGTDAPNSPTPSFTIDPGVVYTGAFEGSIGGDSEDWYAFTAPAGATLDTRVAGTAVTCASLYDAAGAELAAACSAGPVEATVRPNAVAAAAGTYYVQVNYNQPTIDDTPPQAYRFSVGVGAPAPLATPVPGVADVVPQPPNGVAPVAPASQADEHVVVAVIDTGINPYHDFFAAPALTDHPSTWLPGFPASAESVSLSLDEPSYEAAVAADGSTWAGLARSTYDAAGGTFDAHLYTFPGTRIIGGVSFGESGSITEPTEPPGDKPILDEHGHGTHSAGLAAGANLAAADGNVLVVMVEVGTTADGVRWAARQPWIDAISISKGNLANTPVTDSPLGDRTGIEWATLEAHENGKPVFNSSGNGFSKTGVAPDHCLTYTDPYKGPAWVTRIGAAKPANGNPTWWHCLPVEAIAKTNVDSPSFDSQARVNDASGTSASAPNAAGHYAHLLLAGRRAGSTATNQEALDYLLHSAAPAPTNVGTNDPSVYPLSLADQGYGLIDQAALDDATARLLTGTGPEPRPETEDWFAKDAEIRRALWGPGSVTAGSTLEIPDIPDAPNVPQDDAGSGGDAPDSRSDAAVVEPGVRYEGTLTGLGTDEDDWYAFEGTAGDVVTLHASGATACYDLVSPSNVVAGSTCTIGYALNPQVTVTLPESGIWYIAIGYFVPQNYSFGFGLDGPPPTVFP